MTRYVVAVFALLCTCSPAWAIPNASSKAPTISAALVEKPTTDATVRVVLAKRNGDAPPPRCRLQAFELATLDTGGQYTAHRGPEGQSMSMTLFHPLWSATWVTAMAQQLAQFDDDTLDNDAVDIVISLADGSMLLLDNVGLATQPEDDGVVRAATHVRLPRQAVLALASSPVVEVTWVLAGTPHTSSLSRQQGQRWYQYPFTCMAERLS